MVSYFNALYFVLWLSVRPVGQSHEIRPEGQSREEALGVDEEYEGGQSQEENEGGSLTVKDQNNQQQLRRQHQWRCPRPINAQADDRMI